MDARAKADVDAMLAALSHRADVELTRAAREAAEAARPPSPPPNPAPRDDAPAPTKAQTPLSNEPPRGLSTSTTATTNAAMPLPPPPPPTDSTLTARRDAHAALLASPSTTRLAKNKAVTQAKLHIKMLSQTRADASARIDGTPQNIGPRALLDFVANKSPKDLEAVMHMLADKTVEVACAGTRESVQTGESNFALAYVSLATCERHPAYADALMAALEWACPYITPGIKDAVEVHCRAANASKHERRSLLGYADDDEAEDAYLLRMQSAVAFYAALLGASLSTVTSQVLGAHASTSSTTPPHPLGGLAAAWRWTARTTNTTKWRWTRFLLQAFLTVVGSDLSLAVPTQCMKLARLMDSKEFSAACDGSAMHPQDDDRILVFQRFCQDALATGAFKRPGRLANPGDSSSSEWLDPRHLADALDTNQADAVAKPPRRF